MSLLTDLFSMMDQRSIGSTAAALGESEHTVSRGMRSAIATVLGGMATKSDNPSLLRSLLDMVPAGAGAFSGPNLGAGVLDPNSPLITTGKSMLSTLFGSSEGAVSQALGAGTGLPSGAASSLLAMAAPVVMGFLGKRVRDQGLSMGGLGNLLQREIPAIREVLPAGVTDLLWPRVHQTAAAAASPVVAQTVTREKSSMGWLLPLVLLCCLVPGLIWLFSHGHRVQTPTTTNSGTANRSIPEAPVVPNPAPAASLPQNVNLYFDTGSARLRPDSLARLNDFANALAANGKNARVTVNGYTDSAGNAAANMRLSQARANMVKNDLIHDGISADRLTVNGYGQDNPAADNSTTEGKGRNRRVEITISQP